MSRLNGVDKVTLTVYIFCIVLYCCAACEGLQDRREYVYEMGYVRRI